MPLCNLHSLLPFWNAYKPFWKLGDGAGPNDIYNADKTGCSTVQKVGNTKVIARKNEKQVGKITSGERGTLVTMLVAINAAGNLVPPFMVFPHVHFISLY